MKKLAIPFRKMAKLLLSGTPRKFLKLLSPLSAAPGKKPKKIYSVKFKIPRVQQIKPIPVTRLTSRLTARFTVPATSANKTRAKTSPVPDTWPYRSIADPLVPAGGEFLTKSYTNLAGTRSYKLYIPGDIPVHCDDRHPMIVMLHGCTQSPDDFSIGTGMNAIACEQRCYVVYPAQSLAANRHRCWNWFKKINQLHGKGEPSIIAGITREVIQHYPIDASRVYIAGLSAGGAMAATMSHLYPELYAAVGIHSGLPHAAATSMPSALSAMSSGIYAPDIDIFRLESSSARPVIVFHGDQDRMVNPANGDQLIARSIPKNNSSSLKKGKVPRGHHYTTTSYKNQQGQSVAEYWQIHGAGHAWAGGNESGSYTDPLGPDASGEMMRFFLSRQLTPAER